MRKVLGFGRIETIMKPSRILFVHSGSDLYGASRSLLRLSSRLVRDGVQVKVVLPHNGPLCPLLEENGVMVEIQRFLPVIERQKLTGIRGTLQLFVKFILSTTSLVHLIRKFRPDLVHSMTAVILSPGPAALMAGVPHIWHIREFFGEFGRLWKVYQKYLTFFSTKIICVSTPVAEQFDRFGHSQKILVIHNGFPADEFENVTCERVENFRARHLPPGSKYLVGVVGRIKFHRKGQEVFVRAASLLRDQFPEARFLCIGSPFPGNESHLTNLLHLISELGLEDYVEYTGDIGDIKAAIKGLDVLVLASTQAEPFGGVVIEAMALSRPVVATNIGGSQEQVVDGVTGYLVQPGSPESMAEGIGKLLESAGLRQEFGQRARIRFLKEFEFELFYRKILDVYQQNFEETD